MASSDNLVAMIGLHFKFQPPDTLYTERRIRLDKTQKTVRIGRTSKRDPNLSPKMNNGWIDSPVISREHAEFSLGDENQAVYIKDLNSRHGTFLNHERLEPNRTYPVAPGDVVKFGTDIQRDELTFPPPSAQVFIATSQANPSPQVAPAQPPHRVFVVPDDSDSSDADSEDDDVMEIRHAVKALREVAGTRHPRLDSEVRQVVSHSAAAQSKTALAPAVLVDITEDRDTTSASAPWIVDLTEASDIIDGVAAGEVAEQADMTTAQVENTQTGTNGVTEELGPEMPETSEKQYEAQPRDRESDMIDLDAETDSDDDECLPDFDTPADDLLSEEDPISFDDDESDNLDSDDSDEEQSDDMVLWDESEPSSPSPNFFPQDSDDAHHAAAKANLEALEEYKESRPVFDPYSGVHESDFDSESDSDMDPEVVETKEITTEAAVASNPSQVGSHDTEELPAQFPQAVTAESAREWPPSADSMPFTSSQPTGLPQAPSTVLPGCRFLETAIFAPEPDYRLRLPSILNDPPQQVPAEFDASMTTQPGLASAVAPGRNQPAEQTEEAFSALAIAAPLAQDPATAAEVPIMAQLVPQSPLIESGDRFLAYPLEETSQLKGRSSPELDMSSAWLFQQSKLNNTTKATHAQPVKEILKAGDAGSTKRKAVDISDVTEAEEAQQAAALAAAITGPAAQTAYKPSVDSSAGIPARYDEDRAPKKVRRMAEAARLFALGGAAAGVALFTTLVATAPSFT